MAYVSGIKIPVVPPRFDLNSHDFPISPKENLLLAMSRKKPVWMPNLYGSSVEAPKVDINVTIDENKYIDWFGVEFHYSEAQGSATPMGSALTSVVNWEKEIKWPDIAAYDFATPDPDFNRDPDRAVHTRLPSACFEQLHFMEGFEQALIDLIIEPKQCRAFFEAMVDFNIKVFDEKYKAYKYDFVVYSDDWGTMRAPFFSTDLLKETLLEPTTRYIAHMKEVGVKVMFHNCGLINDFIPYIAEIIQPDVMDSQVINDVEAHMKRYGDRMSFDVKMPDVYIFYDPRTTLDTVRVKAKEYVDTYGAHVMPGAGGLLIQNAATKELINAFWDEIYAYSMIKYKGN